MASLAIVNGSVWPASAGATAVAVAGDRIEAVGADSEIRDLLKPRGRLIDAGGATVVPAFNDAHCHFVMGSRGLGQLDLSGLATQAEIERRIRDFAASAATPWVIGRGWLYSAFTGGMPTLELLDRLVPDRPAYLESFDTHCAWVNTRALARAGIDPERGDGVLKERTMEEFERHVPAPSRDEDLGSLRAGLRLAASRGIASIQEASRGLDELPLFLALDAADQLTIRIRLAFDMIPGLSLDGWESRLHLYEEAARSLPSGCVSTGILKAFADGVVESKTALMLDPYEGSAERGEPIWSPGELAAAVHAADRRGWQVEVHAIGDAAIREALDAFEGTASGRRHRVEHIEAPAAADIPRFAGLGAVASMQPQHADPKLTEVWLHHLGPERAARGWPWRRLLETGAHVAFGTDWPVVPLDPFASIDQAAKSITPDDAIAAWTAGAAYAEHAETEKGALREGMLADIALVDFERREVAMTVVGGRVVFER